jgi:Mg-chelatase subunit ChlI
MKEQSKKPLSLFETWEIYQTMKWRLSKDVFGRDEDWKDGDWREKLYGSDGGEGLGTLQLILTAILSGGHVLLEDYPGSGKSFLAKKLSECFKDDLEERKIEVVAFRRIQCVPDLLPADIVGYNRPAQGINSSSTLFLPGPIFAHFVLLDEINRTTPKVQSAMLEAMAEGQVTVEGVGHNLGELFFVIATQNPLDKTGTYPLPAASLDRFIFKRTLSPVGRNASVRIMLESGPNGKALFEAWRKDKTWCKDEKDSIAGGGPTHYDTNRQVLATELVAAKGALKEQVKLSHATVEALLNLDRLIAESCSKPFADTGILFEEGSRPSPRTLQRLAGTLKVMALIREGERLEKQAELDDRSREKKDQSEEERKKEAQRKRSFIEAGFKKFDAATAPLETDPSLLKPIVADFMRHRVHIKSGRNVSPRDLETCLVSIAEEAVKRTLIP